MGVQGLIPLLLKHCPHVVKQHKSRLQSFEGKTVVLDGTLLTHRFHFSPWHHRYRHIYGWYRLLTELRDNNVSAICVFDGDHRIEAKSAEALKRVSARRLSGARAGIEADRQRRLRSLNNALREFMVLPPHERSSLSSEMRSLGEEAAQANACEVFESELHGQAVSYGMPGEFDTSGYYDAFRDRAEPDFDRSVLRETQELPLASNKLDDHQPLPYTSPGDLVSMFSELQDSSRIIQKSAPSIAYHEDGTDDIKESRNQLALTQEETRIWNEIRALATQPHEASTTLALADLIQRSQALSEAYERRSRSPPPETHQESRMLIEAMGIPCIESTVPYEAEGLASSLVRHGLAHYVASEDTDVLVYGACLMRNITSRSDPITTISSAEVRQALGFSRAAFTDFAILLGTDFTARIRNVGPVRALAFIKTYSRIERILKEEKRYQPSEVRSYLESVDQARSIFSSLPPVPSKQRLEIHDVDKEKVTELLSRFKLSKIAMEKDWMPETLLNGDYFEEYGFGGGEFPEAYCYE